MYLPDAACFSLPALLYMYALASPTFECTISPTPLWSMFSSMDLTASGDTSFAIMLVAKGISFAYRRARRPVADRASRMVKDGPCLLEYMSGSFLEPFACW